MLPSPPSPPRNLFRGFRLKRCPASAMRPQRSRGRDRSGTQGGRSRGPAGMNGVLKWLLRLFAVLVGVAVAVRAAGLVPRQPVAAGLFGRGRRRRAGRAGRDHPRRQRRAAYPREDRPRRLVRAGARARAGPALADGAEPARGAGAALGAAGRADARGRPAGQDARPLRAGRPLARGAEPGDAGGAARPMPRASTPGSAMSTPRRWGAARRSSSSSAASISPWTPADSLAILKLMALRLTDAARDEVRRARALLVLPPERVKDILPEYPLPARDRARSGRRSRVPETARPGGAGAAARRIPLLDGVRGRAPSRGWRAPRTPGRWTAPLRDRQAADGERPASVAVGAEPLVPGRCRGRGPRRDRRHAARRADGADRPQPQARLGHDDGADRRPGPLHRGGQPGRTRTSTGCRTAAGRTFDEAPDPDRGRRRRAGDRRGALDAARARADRRPVRRRRGDAGRPCRGAGLDRAGRGRPDDDRAARPDVRADDRAGRDRQRARRVAPAQNIVLADADGVAMVVAGAMPQRARRQPEPGPRAVLGHGGGERLAGHPAGRRQPARRPAGLGRGRQRQQPDDGRALPGQSQLRLGAALPHPAAAEGADGAALPLARRLRRAAERRGSARWRAASCR